MLARQAAPDSTPKPLLVDARYVAVLTSLSLRTIKRMAAADEIPGGAIRIGRSVRFRLDLIESWVARGCPRVTATKGTTRR
jgi:excisionase family DNA binding protein